MLKRLLSLFSRPDSAADTGEASPPPESAKPRSGRRPRARNRRQDQDDPAQLTLGETPAPLVPAPRHPPRPSATTAPERARAAMAPAAPAPVRIASATSGERPPHFTLIDTPAGLAPLYAALDRVDEVAMVI